MSRKLTELAAQYVLLALAVVTLNFFIVYLAPGDPVGMISRARIDSGERELSAEDQRMLERYFGMDRPLARQYLDYLGQLAAGDLGYSFFFNRPAGEILFDYGKRTLVVVFGGMGLAFAIGLPLGMYSASRRGTRQDSALLVAHMVVHSMPPFFIATLLLIVFAVELRWLPFSGSGIAAAGGGAGTVVRHTALPALALAIWESTAVYYFTRGALVDVLSQEFILTARAKGLSRRAVLVRHAIPAVLPTLITRFALIFGMMVGGVFFVEQVFSYPGIASLALTAFQNHDYLLLRGVFLWLTAAILIANFAADICVWHLDPRAREEA